MDEPVAKRVRMNIDNSDAVNLTKIGILPREILCIIFSHLDKKSVRNATASCKLWFELIRSDSELSGYICLEKFGLKQLFIKMLDGEWKWERWPVLKTLKLGGLSAFQYSKQKTAYLTKLVDFKACPTLEKVVISVSCTLTGMFPKYPGLPLGIIEELTFDPKIDIESVGIEHVSRVKFVLDGDPSSEQRFDTQARTISQNLKLLKSTAYHLKSISVIGRDVELINFFLPTLFSEEMRDLKNSFGQMFQQLDKTLDSVHVIVGRICDIDNLFSDSTPITEIWIQSLCIQEKSICPEIRQEVNINRLTKLFDRFKKLRKCRVDLELSEECEDQTCDTWPNFVEKNFQEIADFKFRFVYCKQIVKNVQNEKVEVLRHPLWTSKYESTKIIRFEITPQ